jgi:Trypsin
MRSPLVLAAFAATAVACSSPATTPGDDADGAPVGQVRSPVIKGSSSPAAQDSVIMIQMGQEGFCSGTLIAPNVVLTARHCVSTPAEDDCGTIQGDMAPATLGIAIGPSANQASAPVAHAKKYFYGAGKDLCEAGDFALILLDRSVTGAPSSKVRAAPATVGETFVAVGYGEDENKQVSVRRQRTGVKALAIGPAQETFTPTNAAAFSYEIPAGEIATSEAVCHGDSGGPLFDLQGRVVGMTSRGADPNDVCVDRPDIFTAVAAHLAVVDQALQEAGFPRTGDESGTKPSSQDDPTQSADEDTTTDEDETPAPKKRKKATPTANAGCSVGHASPGDTRAPAGAFGLLLLALTAWRASSRRRLRT